MEPVLLFWALGYIIHETLFHISYNISIRIVGLSFMALNQLLMRYAEANFTHSTP